MKRPVSRVAAPSLALSPILSDHMVIQRNRPISIWGTDRPGQKVRVTLGGSEVCAKTGHSSRWKLVLPAMKAGGPHRIKISGSSSRIVRDVMLGDVWIASGQSNMQYEFINSLGARKELARASLPIIRFFNVAKGESSRPRRYLSGKWIVCGPETVVSMSAVAYYFGKTLSQSLDIPIGLIVSAWSGTMAECWTPRPEIEADPKLEAIPERWKLLPRESRHILSGPWPVDIQFKEMTLIPREKGKVPVSIPLKAGSGIRAWTADTRGARVEPSAGRTGPALSFRGFADPGEWASAQCRLAPGGMTADLSGFDSLQFAARGKGHMQVELEQPSVKDWDRFSSEPLQVDTTWKHFVLPLDRFKQAGWGVARNFTPGAISAVMLHPLPPVDGPKYPGGLFNAMISPLTDYRVKGVIWYQGESNAERALEYRGLLPALIKGWRKAWKDTFMPFLIVQLPNYMKRSDQPGESSWAALREAQLKTSISLPMTGLAVTIDLGEADNVHPHDKRGVGLRLAYCALGLACGKPGEHRGPAFQMMEKDRGKLRLHFTHTGAGLSTKDTKPVRGFAVAGPDLKFHWARARIEHNTVLVWSPRVPKPQAVRYAWADNPDCNLMNREGFLASPFRTDR